MLHVPHRLLLVLRLLPRLQAEVEVEVEGLVEDLFAALPAGLAKTNPFLQAGVGLEVEAAVGGPLP